MESALYQKLFRGKKEDKDTRVNWSDNPIPEDDKKAHPQFKLAMQRINKYNNFEAKDDGMLGSMTTSQREKQKDKFFLDSIQTPTIEYKGKSYSLQSLIPD
jgi:hypothetical protein